MLISEGLILVLLFVSFSSSTISPWSSWKWLHNREGSRMDAWSWRLPRQALITHVYGKAKRRPACSSHSHSTWACNMLRQRGAKVIWLVCPKLLCKADGRNLWLCRSVKASVDPDKSWRLDGQRWKIRVPDCLADSTAWEHQIRQGKESKVRGSSKATQQLIFRFFFPR